MSLANAPFSLTYLPLLIQLKCVESAKLPVYLGSMLHGIVGWALSSNSKAYSYIFENRNFGGAKQDIANPYIIEPPRYRSVYEAGDVLSFKIILLGNAVNYVQDVVTTLAKTTKFGLGAERKIFVLESIMQGERFSPIWQDNKLNANSAIPEMLVEAVQNDCSRCSVHLLTPLRIRRGGELVLKPDFITIIRNITKRLDMLVGRYGGYIESESVISVLDQANTIVERSADLYVTHINRYSSRRDEKMDMSGLLGTMTFEGELSVFTPWLNAARKLHIGRNSTFGYGQIDVVFG